MSQFLVLAATMGALSIGLSTAQNPPAKIAIPVVNVSPTDGKQMFTSYCAQCHGVDGRGAGPIASELQKPPADLTRIAKNNGGRFPEARISAVLEFGIASSGNRPSQMPAWGSEFVRRSHLSPNDKELRILNLIRYLESIQAR
ncbi:MAG: c-type cytochrome [Terracidiphilus sp.]